MNKETEKYIHILQEKHAVDLSVYDHSFLENTIKSRMAQTLCNTLDNYLDYLDRVPGEFAGLLDLLSNSTSEFFRNSLTFSILEQIVIPRLFNHFPNNHFPEIRIWSAGCAAGQEPYSLALLFNEYAENQQPDAGYRIFATDTSATEIEKARKGSFDFKAMKNTRMEWVEKYFRRKGENFLLNREIMDQVNFSVFNLLDENSSSPPSAVYGDFDLIMCSNVLIYYREEYQQLMLQKIYRSLKKGGFLITGEAESCLVSSMGGFKLFVSPAPIFVKN